MAKKAGIYISPPIASLIEGRTGVSLSGRLAQVAERYVAALEACRPALSEAEWNALRDILNGYWMGDLQSIRLMWAEVADAGADGIDEKWGVDTQALAERLRKMSLCELIAIAEAMESWWAEQSGDA